MPVSICCSATMASPTIPVYGLDKQSVSPHPLPLVPRIAVFSMFLFAWLPDTKEKEKTQFAVTPCD